MPEPLERRTILIDARSLVATPTGVGNYARNLIPELVSSSAERGDDFRWVVARHESNLEPLCDLDDPSRYMEIASSKKHGDLRDFALGQAELHEWLRTWGPAALVHDLFHISPLRWFDLGPIYRPRFVTTLHDLIWLDHARASQSSLLKAAWVKGFGTLSIPHTIYYSDHVICVSEATRERARHLLDDAHTSVIPHGVHASFFDPAPPGALPGQLSELLESQEPYVCTVSNDKRYKNVDLLLEAFARHRRSDGASGKLVLVGNYDRIAAKARQLGIAQHVVFAGVLEQDDMRAVVSHSRLFVFPSLVEGFGLPPLEAMACGVPTVVSDIEPMRSIAGDGAMICDPHDVESLAMTITRLFCRDDLHAQWSDRARGRAAKFTWKRCAEQTLDAYHVTLAM